MNKKVLQVVAGVIQRDETILIGQRKDPGPRQGKWEFPGGKIREGEAPEEALAREIREEHGISVRVEGRMSSVQHDYGDLCVHVSFYRCFQTDDVEPSCHEHQAIAWVKREDLDKYDFLEADRPFLTELMEQK